MESKSYYFITVFHSYNEFGPHGMRCWGFYKNFNEAYDTLTNNITDLWEYTYDYGIIEEYKEGIGNYQFKRWFYKYNESNNQYEEMEEPEELKHYVGFAFG